MLESDKKSYAEVLFIQCTLSCTTRSRINYNNDRNALQYYWNFKHYNFDRQVKENNTA